VAIGLMTVTLNDLDTLFNHAIHQNIGFLANTCHKIFAFAITIIITTTNFNITWKTIAQFIGR